MSGKLKIIRVLSNPSPRRRPKKKTGTATRKVKKRAPAPPAKGDFVLRVITPDGRALWRTKSGWTKDRKGARRFKTKHEGAKAFNSSFIAKRDNWTVADVMPA